MVLIKLKLTSVVKVRYRYQKKLNEHQDPRPKYLTQVPGVFQSIKTATLNSH